MNCLVTSWERMEPAVGGQTFGFEDAIDAVAVEVGQEVPQREGQVVEREAGHAAQMADNGALFVGGPPPQVRGT